MFWGSYNLSSQNTEHFLNGLEIRRLPCAAFHIAVDRIFSDPPPWISGFFCNEGKFAGNLLRRPCVALI
jgi:hypothetical protein